MFVLDKQKAPLAGGLVGLLALFFTNAKLHVACTVYATHTLHTRATLFIG